MSEPLPPQPPEILKAIQAAERKVARMIESAEQEAAAIVERARAEAEALLAARRRAIEEDRRRRLLEGATDAEREADRLIREATDEAAQMVNRGLRRLDEAAGFVLQRILPSTISHQLATGDPERTTER